MNNDIYKSSIYRNGNGGGLQEIAQDSGYQACNCIGPQNGQPACPCAMRNVKVVNGRWVRTEDLGPVGDCDGGKCDS
jgi:hypothetical protein